MNDSEIVFMDAVDIAANIHKRRISCLEVMEAHLAQVERVNPKVNAICTLVAEKAMDAARVADDLLSKGKEVGPLFGLPVAIKDLTATKGVRTTMGSTIYATTVPDQDDLIVTRLKAAGAIVIGKTNTPEFGAGSHTFNQVFGSTRNPYDTNKTCGGSSGGAAVAVACGMVPIAEGSDFGGSLRNPAAWCNVVGFRTTVGLVPRWPSALGWSQMSVNGPMTRTVRDAALMLSSITGADPRVPLSVGRSSIEFSNMARQDMKGARIAWSNDLGGRPVEDSIIEGLKPARGVLEGMGCIVSDEAPDLSDSDDVFQTIRAYLFAHNHAEHLKHHRDELKQTIVWNTEKGLALSGLDIAKSEEKRTKIWERMAKFWEGCDFLCMPVTSLPPFPIEWEYPDEIAGRPMNSYVDWMWPCYTITVTGSPAISVPAGFTADGLPIGLQIVGKPYDDMRVLQMALSFEEATQFHRKLPRVVE